MLRLVDAAYALVAAGGDERLRFSVSFALFEYALKECIAVDERGGRAFANWPEFERRRDDLAVLGDAETASAVRRLLARPPKVQMASGGHAVFRDRPLEGTQNQCICEALRRIRNSLFHGGKQPYTADDAERVRLGLQIIGGYLAVHDDLRAAFEMGMR